MVLWCRGKGDDEFVVAELNLFRISDSKVFADICFLRSSCTSADGDQLGGTWDSTRVDILCRDDNPDQVVVDIQPDDVLDFKCIDNDAGNSTAGAPTPSSPATVACAGSTTTGASSSVTCLPPLLSPSSGSLCKSSLLPRFAAHSAFCTVACLSSTTAVLSSSSMSPATMALPLEHSNLGLASPSPATPWS